MTLDSRSRTHMHKTYLPLEMRTSLSFLTMGVHMGVHIWHSDVMSCILQRRSRNVDMTLDSQGQGKIY